MIWEMFLLVFWLLISLIDANPPDACLLRCKDNYLQHMQSLAAEKSQMWSISLSTPLQGLFSKHSHLSVYDRLSVACDAHKQFVVCLNRCSDSKGRKILEAGQSSWSFICNSFEDSPDFQDEVLPCWQSHGELISTKCHIHAVMVQNSVMDLIQNGWADPTSTLDDLCRSVTLYDKCYIGQSDVHCGQKGWKFLLQLNTRNSMVLVQLLSQSAGVNVIPWACQQWKHPVEYAEWHAQRLTTSSDSGYTVMISLLLECILFILIL